MSSLDKRQTNVRVLHPAFRGKVEAVKNELNAEGLPFDVFEALRTPQRQQYLFAQGRSRPGPIVTKARPWSSYHQYGLAVDFVLFEKGRWSWETSGAKAKAWKRLHEIGRRHDLEPLSFELPHLQLAGLDIASLKAGRLPDGGDEAWEEAIEELIVGWSGEPSAPRLPRSMAQRPPLTGVDEEDAPRRNSVAAPDSGRVQDLEPALDRPAVPPAKPSSEGRHAMTFARIQPFIDKWEGGYVDHPDDPGGATNMGVTLATLQRWRQRPVTKADVKALQRDEVWQIMKAFYFDVVRGEDLPLPVAAVAHNAAVLHGPSRSAEFLQTALRGQGGTVDIDGVIGPQTLGAVARCDPHRLCHEFVRLQEAYLRSLPRFSVFGAGWMNRLNDLRTFVASLPVTAPASTTASERPAEAGSVVDGVPPQAPRADGVLASIEELLRHLLAMMGGPAQPPGAEKGGPASRPGGGVGEKLAALEPLLREWLANRQPTQVGPAPEPGGVHPSSGSSAALTPVNAALGTTLGRLLDGRKSAIGIIGSVLTSVLPTLARDLGLSGGVLPTISAAVPYLQPLALALAAWGVLGKIDKWARLPPDRPTS